MPEYNPCFCFCQGVSEKSRIFLLRQYDQDVSLSRNCVKIIKDIVAVSVWQMVTTGFYLKTISCLQQEAFYVSCEQIRKILPMLLKLQKIILSFIVQINSGHSTYFDIQSILYNSSMLCYILIKCGISD